MRILCDYHHPCLYRSLELLFQDRLGYELHRAIGLQWAKKNIFTIHKLGEGTPYPEHFLARLLDPYVIWDEYHKDIPSGFKLVQLRHVAQRQDYTLLKDPQSNRNHIGVTYEQALKQNYDLILVSYPEHFTTFTNLRDQYWPEAKVICHVGNYWPEIPKEAVNVITSLRELYTDRNTLQYHPEFDLSLFNFTLPPNPRSILSLMHRNPSLLSYEGIPSSFTRKHFGMGADVLNTEDEVAQAMKDTGFIWLVKPEGDGYGFTLHRALAMGRPVIYRSSQFNIHMPGYHLLEHRVNGIDLDQSNSLEEELELAIRNYFQLAIQAYKRFKEVVDFDKEFEKIKKFLGDLK